MTRRYPPQLLRMLHEELEASGLMVYLDRADTTDIMVNPDGSVWVYGTEGSQQRVEGASINPDSLESLLGTVASLEETVITAERPILEANLPVDRVRLQAVLPPVAESPLLALRKPPARLLTMDDLVASQTLPRSTATHLTTAVEQRLTCVVAGGVGTGKTTLVNALLHAQLQDHPEERIVILEEGARELQADGANVIRLLTSSSAGVDMTDLVRASLRLNPSRILIGEVRGAEALDWLRAANTGHPGSLLTVHANSAVDALYRLDMLVQEARVPSQLGRLVEAVDLVVFVARHSGPSGPRRQVTEVIQVKGLDRSGRVTVTPIYSTSSSGADPRALPLPLDQEVTP